MHQGEHLDEQDGHDEHDPSRQQGLTRRAVLQGAAVVAGTAAALAAPGIAGLARTARAAAPVSAAGQKPNILLVHGAWADGSSWSRVIPILRERGHTALAVQLAHRSLADDIAHTRQVLADRLQGPTVLVGHSYGGAVISGAATGLANVISLVFASAFAPDEGESLLDLDGRFPPPPVTQHLQVDSQGFIWIDPAAFREVFCQDVSEPEAGVLADVQQPLAGAAFGEKSGPVAWHALPSWYLVSTLDRAIAPDLERFMAARMHATTVEVASSHASPVSHPREVAELIFAAARA